MKEKKAITQIFETGIELFPYIQALFIDDNLYVLLVEAKTNQHFMSRWSSFVILKNFTLNVSGFQLYRNNPELMDNCFDNNKKPCKDLVKILNEVKVLEMHESNLWVSISGRVYMDNTRTTAYNNILNIR